MFQVLSPRLLPALAFVFLGLQPQVANAQHFANALRNISFTKQNPHQSTQSSVPSPSDSRGFLTLPDGTYLRDMSVRNIALRMIYGTGERFGSNANARYERLHRESIAPRDRAYPIQWTIVELSTGRELATSHAPDTLFFGASVSKVFVAATLLDRLNDQLSRRQKQLMADMLVVSSNTAWIELQNQIGDGDTFTGQSRIHEFTQRMNYPRTRGFQGWMGDEHGNELTAYELGRFMTDTYNRRYNGAETLWKMMFTSRTGSTRGKKYLPDSMFVGGKTGTYVGRTVDPETDLPEDENGNPYRVQVYHHLLVVHHDSIDYAIVLLGNTGNNEDIAVMAGGLYREYILQKHR